MATKRDVLLHYCKRGFHLFPVKKETKRPAIKDNLNKASNDIDQLMEWDKKFPNCNWAISCAKSGLVAVDVDHVFRAGQAVEAVDVLRQHASVLEVVFHLGDDLVAPVGQK